jgi:hypothetical protein
MRRPHGAVVIFAQFHLRQWVDHSNMAYKERKACQTPTTSILLDIKRLRFILFRYRFAQFDSRGECYE